ncbi:hypothetical protein TRIP_B250079 [uncultured Desulfatiglans sp.]|uniref:Uncharacterized protein n=1 Tax=Uncultured Desulfatiglans sp. TaxID=1748965 RepID=A0A653A5K8_UNCDX|nr:hypothetical protein TRIP_B250079 [uncultured Desulfatiglans sp.]
MHVHLQPVGRLFGISGWARPYVPAVTQGVSFGGHRRLLAQKRRQADRISSFVGLFPKGCMLLRRESNKGEIR